jgi:uncharacterized protein YlxW (UPF0749 family)
VPSPPDGSTAATPTPREAELEAELREARARVTRLEREVETTSRELERVKRSNSWRVTEPLRAAKAKLGARR